MNHLKYNSIDILALSQMCQHTNFLTWFNPYLANVENRVSW